MFTLILIILSTLGLIVVVSTAAAIISLISNLMTDADRRKDVLRQVGGAAVLCGFVSMVCDLTLGSVGIKIGLVLSAVLVMFMVIGLVVEQLVLIKARQKALEEIKNEELKAKIRKQHTL